MATDIIARGMASGVVSQVSADRQAVSEDRAAVETAKTEVLNVAESIPEDYSTLSADVSELKEDLVDLTNKSTRTFNKNINVNPNGKGAVSSVDGAITPSEDSRYQIIDVSNAESISFNITKYNGNYGYAFFNGSTFLSGKRNDDTKRVTVLIPKNATTIAITWRATGQQEIVSNEYSKSLKSDDIKRINGISLCGKGNFIYPWYVEVVLQESDVIVGRGVQTDGKKYIENGLKLATLNVENISVIRGQCFNTSANYGVAFYDSNDNFIIGVSYTDKVDDTYVDINVPLNAKTCLWTIKNTSEIMPFYLTIRDSNFRDGYNALKMTQNFGVLSDEINSDLFEKKGYLVKQFNATQTKYEASTDNSTTLFVNIDRVEFIVFNNLYKADDKHGYRPVFIYDENFKLITNVEIFYKEYAPSQGYIDLKKYPNAKFAIFCNFNNSIEPDIKLYTRNEKDKEYRNKVYVGCYYFAGWSELDFPNIHLTDSIMNEYDYREPVWGWIEHGCYKGEGWLITPSITLNSGISTVTITNSCLFHKEGQCSVFIREVGKEWVEVETELPNDKSTVFVNTTIDVSSFGGKSIQIGLRLKNNISEISAVWTINSIKVVSNGSTIYDKDYTNHNNFDCMITDDDIWKPATHTLGYEGVNGYVGCTYDQKDFSIIDKQIIMAKENGIDYFILDWYYHDNQGNFNQTATEREDNHIAINAFVNSAQKYNFKYIIMISNHSGFEITNLQRWKDALTYLNDTYFKDSAYLIVNNKPVINVFANSGIEKYLNDLNLFMKDELGYDGVIWQLGAANTRYNTIPTDNGSVKVQRDFSELIEHNKAENQRLYNLKRPTYYPFLTSGWDSRPWANRPNGYARPSDWYTRDVKKWSSFFKWGYQMARYQTMSEFKSVLIYAFNEYGEGGYLAPTKGDKKASYLCEIKKVKDSV